MLKILYTIIILLIPFGIFSQIITILDGNDSSGIPQAHVCTESANKKETHFWVTDLNGKVNNDLKLKSKVAISFMGYHTIIDSIEPGKSYTFRLVPTSTELSDVVVTGQYKPQTIDKSIYNIQLIRTDGIAAKASTNLGELLNNETNIQINNNGVLGQTISMQGLSGEHIKILVDGVPVIGRQNGSIDLGQINLSSIHHIEIIEGPMSVVYGSNALGGVINLITNPDTRPLYKLQWNGQYESVGLYQTNVNFIKNINKHQFTVNSGYYRFNGYVPDSIIRYVVLEDASMNKFDPKRQFMGDAMYRYSDEKITLKLSQDFFNEMLLNKSMVSYRYYKKITDTSHYDYPSANDENHYTNRLNSKIELNYRFSDEKQINLLAGYSFYSKTKQTWHNNLYSGKRIPLNDSTYYDTTLFNSFVFRTSYNYWSDVFKFQGGIDLNTEAGKGKRIGSDKSIEDFAGFASIQYNPHAKFCLQPGLRLIYNSRYDAPVVYSMNLKYDPIQTIQLRASYGRGFRSPSLKELYLNFVDASHNVKGNPDLKAEYSHNFSLSANYSQNPQKMSIDYALRAYHNLIENKIDFAYDSINPAKADYININGVYRTTGVQLDIAYKLHPRFNWSAGGHYFGRSRNDNPDRYTTAYDLSSSLGYHNLKYRFRFNIFYKYYGKQAQYYIDSKSINGIREEQRDGYHMLDFTVSRPFFNDNLTITAGIKNILNVTTVLTSGNGSSGAHGSAASVGGNIGYGRTWFVKLAFNLSKFKN